MYRFNDKLPKSINAYRFILMRGLSGVTEMDIYYNAFVISGRNYCTELERKAHIILGRERLDNITSGKHTRYFIQTVEDAVKVISYVNRVHPGAIKKAEIIAIKRLYPSAAPVKANARQRVTRAALRAISHYVNHRLWRIAT